jgi:hypothetical protein
VTAPTRADVSSSFSFGVAGDFNDGKKFKATRDLVKELDPAFMLALGDLSYDDQEGRWCQLWTDAGYGKLLIQAGNHDSGEDKGGNINKYVSSCPKAGVATVGDYGKQYYFDYPDTGAIARFIMISPGLGGNYLGIDTNFAAGRQGYKFTQAAIDDARAKGIAWIIVAMHKNYITPMEKGNEVSTDDDRTFMTMLLNKKVDLVLQGHEHGYARSKQLTTNSSTCRVLPTGKYLHACVVDEDNELTQGVGTVIHIIGTAGQGLRHLSTADPEYPYFKASNVTAYGFGHFTLTPSSLSFVFRRSAGDKFGDMFTITR